MSKKEEKVVGPQYYLSPINNEVLNYNVYEMKPAEKTVYSIALLLVGGVVGLIYYGGLFKAEDGSNTLMTMISNIVVFLGIGLVCVKVFIPILEEMLRNKRINKLRKQFCDFASSLTNALASGMNMNDSLIAVYNDLQSQYSDDSYIVVEVKEILDGMNNNIPVETMLESFGNRSGIPDITNFATVFATCFRTGGNIKSIVRRTSEIISEKTMIESEIQTTITSNKMQMNIMNVLPIVILIMLRFMSAEFAESFSSIVGVIGLTLSAGLTIVAFKLGQKVMDIK